MTDDGLTCSKSVSNRSLVNNGSRLRIRGITFDGNGRLDCNLATLIYEAFYGRMAETRNVKGAENRRDFQLALKWGQKLAIAPLPGAWTVYSDV